MNIYPATAPRTWLIAAAVVAGIAAANVGLAPLWDAEAATVIGRWEGTAMAGGLVVLLLCSAIARQLEESWTTVNARFLSIMNRLSRRQWLGVAGLTWLIGWIAFHMSGDPEWVSSGIDWHDSHLDAYSLLYGDPPLYCAWRYPLYPYMAATVSYWTGWDLGITTQLVSRIAAIATAVPLYIVGRTLFGRSAAIAGILLLTSLATFRMHTDAVTPYPLVMFLAATGAACITLMGKGRWWVWLAAGITTGALLANDGKSLLISLGFAGLALPLALIVTGRLHMRVLRILVFLAPIGLSYQWMGNLPVKAFTLEEMAVAYLVPGGRGAAQAPRNLQTGYMWGHFEDAATIPRTLLTFYEAGRNPELAEQNARQLGTSLQRLRLDYPGFSIRVPIALGLVLLLPLARRRDRFSAALAIAGAGVVLASCWPSIKSDYQERYVVHGAAFLPLLWMGGVGMAAKLIIGDETPTRQWIRRLSVLGIALGMMLWPTNPVGLVQLEQRLDPVAMGGGQEHEVAEWGREHMQSGDLLLDTSWMMQALLLSGTHTVARAPNAYPPGGAAWPAGAWRFTRPWPEERTSSGRYYALVNYLAMAPNTFDATHAPIEDLITGPDTDMGKAVANNPDAWEEVFRTSDTIVRIYRYRGSGAPPRWQTKRRPL